MQSKLYDKFRFLPAPQLAVTEENKCKAQILLVYIELADYENSQKIWKENPELMFVEVKDDKDKSTTPLKRALFLLDTWSWKPFFEWLTINNGPLLHEFFKQAALQSTHVSMVLLFKAYDAFNNRCKNLRNGFFNFPERAQENEQSRSLSLADLSKELSNAQRSNMPWHMLREMCRKSSWHSWQKAGLEERTPPKASSIYSEHVHESLDLDSEDFKKHHGWDHDGKGKGVILRGTTAPSLWVPGNVNNAYLNTEGREIAAIYDANILYKLYKKRSFELVEMVSLARSEKPETLITLPTSKI